MAAFQGNLADIDLATVLQNLRGARKTGTLALRKGSEERWFRLDSGVITMVSRGEGWTVPLVEILLRSAKDKKKLRAFAKRRRTKPLHDALLRSKVASKEELAAALRACVEEEACEIFSWKGGAFEFHEGPAPDGLFDPAFRENPVAVETQALMLEAARRADEWDRIRRQVGGDGDVFIPVRPVEDLEEEWIAAVAGLVDGRKTVGTIAAEAGVEGFHAKSAVAYLAEVGYIRRATGPELVGLAPSLDPAEAVSALRGALQSKGDDPELRAILAASLARTERTKEAAVEYKLAASALAEREKLDEAVKLLQKAAELSPKDIAAREKLVELARRLGREKLIEEISLQLARLYRRAGLAEKAVRVMEELRGIREPDEETEVELAEALLAAGKADDAAKGLERAADGFASRGRDQAAAVVLERLLRLSPEDRRVKEKLGHVRAGIYRRSRRRRLLARLAVYGGCVVFYLTLVCAREMLALLELERARRDASRMVFFGVLHDTRRRATQAFSFARERCEDVARIFGRESLYPPTWASARAAEAGRAYAEDEACALKWRARRQEALARSAPTEGQRHRLLFLARETCLELARCSAAPESLRTEGARKAESLARELASALGGGSS